MMMEITSTEDQASSTEHATTTSPPLSEPAPHAFIPFRDVLAHGPPSRPLDFPPPRVLAGVRINALVVHPATGSRQVCSGVIHRQEHLTETTLAYWPQRRLQDAIYGSVWACLVLRRHFGAAADDAARAAGVAPGAATAPMVWEITGTHVAIKMVEWARVHHMRGRLLEDPVKEVAAMQMLGGHENVLGSTEVLQDKDFLYSVMPYCRDGDLFGIVVKYAEESGGDIGMPEPVARYWFRQILWGLHHLQAKGVCHRDLSLENVLVDGARCMIIDMGMCLRVPYNDPEHPESTTDVSAGQQKRRLMKPQGVCGKHNYMSPEVHANQTPFDGFAIDLWAAGVILYIMLTGFPPYDQATRADQRFELIVTGRLMEQLKNWDINVSESAGDLLQRMLVLPPHKRMTLAQVLSHPWVTDTNVEAPPKEEILAF